MYGLSYSDFVVPLVKGMQEQQTMIEAQTDTIKILSQTVVQQQEILNIVLAKIEVMSSQLNDIKECCNNNSNSGSGSLILCAPQLFSAVPNPASGSTVVYYYVPLTSKSVSIQLADANGQIIQSIEVVNYGYSSIPLQVGNLSNSVYSYSLIVDGKLIDSKQLSIIQK